MPKIVVMVEKDETGRLWDYVFQEKESPTSPNTVAARPIWIHRVDNIESEENEGEKAELVRDESGFVEVCSVPIFEEEKFAFPKAEGKGIS